MRSALNWFEIAVTDMERAKAFYERLLGAPLRIVSFFGAPHAVLPYEAGVGGALVLEKDRKPSAEGTVVYLNANGRFEDALAAIPEAGGTVVVGKTDIGEMGTIAVFRDTEGNIVGLHADK